MQDQESQLLGLVEAWSQKFNIPEVTMRERLKDVAFIETRQNDQASPAPAYTERDVRRVCADLISDDFNDASVTR